MNVFSTQKPSGFEQAREISEKYAQLIEIQCE